MNIHICIEANAWVLLMQSRYRLLSAQLTAHPGLTLGGLTRATCPLALLTQQLQETCRGPILAEQLIENLAFDGNHSHRLFTTYYLYLVRFLFLESEC